MASFSSAISSFVMGFSPIFGPAPGPGPQAQIPNLSAIGNFIIGISPIGGAPWPGTAIRPLGASDFASRIAAVFPNGWASQDARQNGLLSFLFGAMGEGMAFQITSLQYALAATRVQTATDTALDLCSEDYFGDGLPRYPGEPDSSYVNRILVALAMLGQGATRAAVTLAVYAVTGVIPIVTEPWSPQDTGVWDGRAGNGMMFWDVDVPASRARWTNDDPYQAFIDTVQISLPILGGNPLPCLDLGNSPNGWYVDAPASGSAFFDFLGSVPTGVQAIYDAINRVKVFGTIVWVKVLPNLTTPLHQ